MTRTLRWTLTLLAVSACASFRPGPTATTTRRGGALPRRRVLSSPPSASPARSSSSRRETTSRDDNDTSAAPSATTADTVDRLKAKLVRCCTRTPKPGSDEVRGIVRELEGAAEQVGIGQSSSFTGLLSGEWELLYSPGDVTRSSPFFWAFEKAFPRSADRIFSVTDAIPAPLKEVGPAYQQIELDPTTNSGRFVSRVRVATLGGKATSVMTTRAAIVGIDGIDGIRLKIETTKPERSTLVSALFGPLGDVVNENAPPFPSGQALERVAPGSSTVILRTTFCDEGIRVSRNDDKIDEVYVFRRKDFSSYEFV